MLIRRADLDRIVAGDIDTAFRCWKRPTVKAGGSLTTVVGVLAIDEVTAVAEADVSAADAVRAGFGSADELLERLAARDGTLYRIRLHWSGEDPRKALRQRANLTHDETAEIRARLDRYDNASRNGPWTAASLALIRDYPATLAATLAATKGWEKAWFKTNIRKLKALGLTESLKVGYRLSPRGAAFLMAETPGD
jgi:hypothetical protein